MNVYKVYERIIIPPQNISLLELKRQEFKEKTKYLDLKILYSLSEEEKTELRNKGYFVDINPKTINYIKNFSISKNRHQGRYCVGRKNYNMAILADNYYVDQNYQIADTDPDYEKKINKPRIRVKKWLGIFIAFSIFSYINYYAVSPKLNELRKLTIELLDKDSEITD